jgi:signal recognition particle subunit SRP68
LVEYPLKLHPVPVKPYFFDIAYNYIGLEEPEIAKVQSAVATQEDKLEEKKPEAAKKGWFWR